MDAPFCLESLGVSALNHFTVMLNAEHASAAEFRREDKYGENQPLRKLQDSLHAGAQLQRSEKPRLKFACPMNGFHELDWL